MCQDSYTQPILAMHVFDCMTVNNNEYIVIGFSYGNHRLESIIEDIEDDMTNYLYQIEQSILSSLKREYEYLTSKEAIKETIEANEYQFTKEGELS